MTDAEDGTCGVGKRFGRSSTDSGDTGARAASAGVRSASAIITKALPAVRPFDPPPAMRRNNPTAAPIADAAGDDAPPLEDAAQARDARAAGSRRAAGVPAQHPGHACARFDLPERLTRRACCWPAPSRVARAGAGRCSSSAMTREPVRPRDPLEAAFKRWTRRHRPRRAQARFAALQEPVAPRGCSRRAERPCRFPSPSTPAADRAEPLTKHAAGAQYEERLTSGPPHRQRAALFRRSRRQRRQPGGNGQARLDRAQPRETARGRPR